MEGLGRFWPAGGNPSLPRDAFVREASSGVQTVARGAEEVRPHANMNGGPFKLPTKENADAAKKKRVRRGCAPRTSRRPNPSPLLIDSHLTSAPLPVHHSRRRSPGSRSGSSLASRISTSRIARASSTSRRCASRYPLSPRFPQPSSTDGTTVDLCPGVDDTSRHPSRRGPFDRNATTDRKSPHPHHPRPRRSYAATPSAPP